MFQMKQKNAFKITKTDYLSALPTNLTRATCTMLHLINVHVLYIVCVY